MEKENVNEKPKYDKNKNLDVIRDSETAKRKGSIGGIKSAESKRRKKNLVESMRLLLEATYTESKAREIVGDLSLLDGDLTVATILNLRMLQEAQEGNVKAYEVVRDTSGFKPTENHNINANIMTEEDKALLEKLAKRNGITE